MSLMSISLILPLQDVTSPFPTILEDSKGQYQLQVDRQLILERPAKKFSLIMEAWFASLWMFAIEYPDKLLKTYFICSLKNM